MMLFQQFHRLPDHIATAAGTGGWSTRLHAANTVEAFKDKVFGAQLFRVKINFFENIDHGGHKAAGQRKRAVVFRIAANLQNPLA